MTPAAYNEVRDKTSRQFLQNFPHKIIQREPSSQSIRFGMFMFHSLSRFVVYTLNIINYKRLFSCFFCNVSWIVNILARIKQNTEYK